MCRFRKNLGSSKNSGNYVPIYPPDECPVVISKDASGVVERKKPEITPGTGTKQ